jgi:hypothetical protein
MVGTLTPVVYGSGRRLRWYWLLSIYTAFQVMGAMLTGLVFAATGMLARALCPWETKGLAALVAVLGIVGALHDLKLVSFRLPSRCWQVPKTWKRFRPSVMAASFGFGIGLGVLTRIPFSGFYLVLLLCAGFVNIPFAVSIMALYGLARAGAVAFAGHSQGPAQSSRPRITRLVCLAPLVGFLNGLALALLAGFLLNQCWL